MNPLIRFGLVLGGAVFAMTLGATGVITGLTVLGFGLYGQAPVSIVGGAFLASISMAVVVVLALWLSQ